MNDKTNPSGLTLRKTCLTYNLCDFGNTWAHRRVR